MTGSRPVDQVRQASLRFIERARLLSVAISASGPPSGAGGRRMGMQYAPESPFDAGTPDTAPPEVLARARPGGRGPVRHRGLNRARSRKPAGRPPAARTTVPAAVHRTEEVGPVTAADSRVLPSGDTAGR